MTCTTVVTTDVHRKFASVLRQQYDFETGGLLLLAYGAAASEDKSPRPIRFPEEQNQGFRS